MDTNIEYMDLNGQDSVFEEYIEVKIGDPRIIPKNEDSRKHTEYDVEIETNSLSFTMQHSKVSRRYSDFVWLRQRLCKSPCLPKPPSLPPKSHIWNFGAKFLNNRKEKLQKFLSRVVRETLFLSSTALHLFLQTSLTPKQMELCIKDGKITETIMESSCRLEKRISHVNSKKITGKRRGSSFTSVTWKVKKNTLRNIANACSSKDKKHDSKQQRRRASESEQLDEILRTLRTEVFSFPMDNGSE